jgi:superfamily II DNA helicase RecQ
LSGFNVGQFILHVFLQMKNTPTPHHVSLVISPLRALARDQVNRMRKMGVQACLLGTKADMTEEDVEGENI